MSTIRCIRPVYIFFSPPSLQFFYGRWNGGTSTEEVLLKREIEDLPVVSSLSFIRAIGRDKAGYRVNLFCNAASSYGGCTDGACTVKRVGPVRMSTKHPTMRDCLRALLARIQQDHGSDCVAAVQAWQAASSAAESTKRPVDEGAASRNANDVLMPGSERS